MNIANEYDLLIIEDDPYMFLQFDAKSIDEVFSDQTDSEFTCSDADSDFEEIVNCATNKVASAAIGDIASSSDERAFCKRYFETLVPSMLKFDTQGRVFRVETFSKVSRTIFSLIVSANMSTGCRSRHGIGDHNNESCLLRGATPPESVKLASC